MNTETVQIASIGRALSILDLLASEAREFGVTEVSERLELSKPIVSRILAVLADEDEVLRNEKSGQYALTLKRPLSAIRFLESIGAQASWMPVLKEIGTQVGELVELTLFRAERLSCVASVEASDRVLKIATTLGNSLPLHATASGKAWLAFAPRSIAIPLLLKEGLAPLTPRTITSLDRLLLELETVRSNGYALAQGEFDEGASAVAAPVRLGTRAEWIVGSFCIALPCSRATPERLRELGLTVQLGAHRLAQGWPSIVAGPYLLPVEDATAPSTGTAEFDAAGRTAPSAGSMTTRPEPLAHRTAPAPRPSPGPSPGILHQVKRASRRS